MEAFVKIVDVLVTPPGLILLVALIGYLIQIRWLWTGNIIVAVSLCSLLVLSLPRTGQQLLRALEADYRPLPTLSADEARAKAGAIVVLAGGRYSEAPEYGGVDTVSPLTLERLRYGAHLHRTTRLPILVSGGSVQGEQPPEASLMQQTLERDYQVKPRWIEDRSRNTLENAQYTKALLDEAGVRRIFLVTHAWHMRRASWAFQNMGFIVTEAPMGFARLRPAERSLLGYFPLAHGLTMSSRALHEEIGWLWYRYYADAPARHPARPAAEK
ncbi:MAG: YdcF family protein [Pseudomonadota bacterium]|nr:MAG: YdcF family protein [Pseudomonadota bacterium]